MSESNAPVLSATVVLVRDGADGLELFMVQRHHKIEFATGALVFPGGKADEGDCVDEASPAIKGGDGLSEAGRQARVAAIRETFEECGVLLARDRGAADFVGGDRFHDLEARYRERVHEGEVGILQMAEAEGLELALDALVPFAHWITPEVSPRRYDTHFFLVTAAADQRAGHDGVESVDSLWISPRAAIEEGEAGRRTVVFPTRRNLEKLARSGSVEEVLAAARAAPVVTVLPVVEPNDEGVLMLRIPVDAGYDVNEIPLEEAFRGKQL